MVWNAPNFVVVAVDELMPLSLLVQTSLFSQLPLLSPNSATVPCLPIEFWCPYKRKGDY
jgi:hypothetical protein